VQCRSYLELAPTIVVDDRLGTEMALTERELVEVCLRLRIPVILARGQLACPTEAVGLWREGVASIGPAIEKIVYNETEAIVMFKRYLPARALQSWERRIVEALREPLPVEELIATARLDPRRCETALRAMEQSRLVTLELDEEPAERLFRAGGASFGPAESGK